MKLDQLDLNSVEAVVDEKVEEKVMIIHSPNCTAALFWTHLFMFRRMDEEVY